VAGISGAGRRAQLDHLITLNERHLQRVLTAYFTQAVSSWSLSDHQKPLPVGGDVEAVGVRPLEELGRP